MTRNNKNYFVDFISNTFIEMLDLMSIIAVVNHALVQSTSISM